MQFVNPIERVFSKILGFATIILSDVQFFLSCANNVYLSGEQLGNSAVRYYILNDPTNGHFVCCYYGMPSKVNNRRTRNFSAEYSRRGSIIWFIRVDAYSQ